MGNIDTLSIQESVKDGDFAPLEELLDRVLKKDYPVEVSFYGAVIWRTILRLVKKKLEKSEFDDDMTVVDGMIKVTTRLVDQNRLAGIIRSKLGNPPVTAEKIRIVITKESFDYRDFDDLLDLISLGYVVVRYRMFEDIVGSILQSGKISRAEMLELLSEDGLIKIERGEKITI